MLSRNIPAFAFLTLCLAACHQDNGEPQSGQATDGAIAFRSEARSRAAAATAVTDAFDVSAFWCNTDGSNIDGSRVIFYQQQVTSNDGGATWSYQPLQYWPPTPQYAVRFFAWAPHNAQSAISASNIAPTQISFHVNESYAAQQDLLVAVSEPLNNGYTTPQGTATTAGEAVKLSFVHALARLSFKLKFASGVESGYTAKIKSLSLYALNDGVFTFPQQCTKLPDGATADQQAALQSTLNQAWYVQRTIPEGGTVRDIPYTAFSLLPGAGLKDANGTYTDAQDHTFNTFDIPASDENKTNGVSLLNDGDYLFMIPQQLPVGTTNPDIPTQLSLPVLNFEYILDNGLDHSDPHWLHTEKTVSLSLASLVASTDDYIWEAGKAYTYVITITGTDVTLNIVPTDWEEGTPASGVNIRFD